MRLRATRAFLKECMLYQPLITERLVIRMFEPADWEAVHAYTSDPDVMRWIPEGCISEEQAQAFVMEHQGEERRAYAVVRQADQQLIGHMFFHLWFAPETYEVGWVFNSAAQGKGYATEAALSLLHYGFEELKLHRIIATCQPENPASYRVMEKLGMRREGYFQQCIYRGDNIWWSEYFYAMLATEWQSLHHLAQL